MKRRYTYANTSANSRSSHKKKAQTDRRNTITDPPIIETNRDEDDFRREVLELRNRSEQVLERILALPMPQKRVKENIKRNTDDLDNNEDPEPPKKKTNKTKKVKGETDKKPDIILPSSEERFNNKYERLMIELKELQQINSQLKSQIRDVQIKLRDSKVEEEKLRDSLEISQQQRLRIRPMTLE